MVAPVVMPTEGMPLVSRVVDAPVPTSRIDAFNAALSRQSDAPGTAETLVAQVQPTPVAAPTEVAPDTNADTRARQALGLDGVPEANPANAGDMILQGIQQLRGVFDVREAHIAELMNTDTISANQLMAMQMEVTNFTLLVDISSKLTGKATQALDTLMKGQ